MKKRINFKVLLPAVLCFLYLSLNVLLNFTPLRQQIVNRLEDKAFTNVQISFMYVNWQFYPTIPVLTLEKKNGVNRGRTHLEFSGVELVPEWSNLWNGSFWNLSENVRKIKVHEADILHRPGRKTGTGQKSISGGGDGGTTIKSSLPEFPLSFRKWSLRFRRDQRESLVLKGKNARYGLEEVPFSAKVQSIQGKSSNVRVRVERLDPLKVRGVVKTLSLPNSFWELQGDNWSGDIVWESGDRTSVEVQLRGVPGVIRDSPLPPVTLSSELTIDESVINVEKASMDSDYLNLDLGGTIDFPGESVDLTGTYSVKFKKPLNKILPVRDDRSVRITTSAPLRGDLFVRGSPKDYRVSGQFALPEATLDLGLRGIRRTVRLQGLGGTLTRDNLKLTRGTIRNRNFRFLISRGEVSLRNGGIENTIEGNLERLAADADTTSKIPLESVFGPVRSADIPIDFSSRITPEAITGELVLKDGSLTYEEGAFRRIRMLVSYSSREGSRSMVRGRWIDPGGNEWQASGNLYGPIGFVSHLENLEPVMDDIAWLNKPFVSGFRLRNVGMRGTIQNPLELKTSYNLSLDLDQSELVFREEDHAPWSLNGSVELTPGTAQFKDVTVGTGSRSNTRITGEINHQLDWSGGSWNLDVRTENLNLDPFLDLGFDGGTDLNLSLGVGGELSTPELSGTFENSTVDLQTFRLTELGGDLAIGSEVMAVRNLDGRMSGGDLSGSLKYRFGNGSTLDLELSRFSLPRIFPSGTWMAEKSQGVMDLQVDLRGRPGQLNSFKGTISGRGDSVVLDNFPEVKDIREVARPSVFEKKLGIDSFRFSFPVDSGVIRVPGFALHSKEVDLITDGEASFMGRLSLDLTLVLRGDTLKRYLQDVLGNIYRRVGLQAGEKKLTIPMKIRGTIDRPVLEIQRDEVSNNFRKNLIKDLFSEPVGKPLNELIDEIFLID